MSVLFGILVFGFWRYLYVSVLSFQEEYQLFLWTSDYAMERIAVPGGLASYVGEFITQFNHAPLFGAIGLSMVFVLFQGLTWLLGKKNGADGSWYLLSFLPALALWAVMGDENVMLAFAVSLVAALGMMLLYHLTDGRVWTKWIYIIVGGPVFYWLFGPIAFLLVIYVCFHEWMNRRKGGQWYLFMPLLLVVLLSVIGSAYVVQYPLERLFAGLEYYRYPVYSSLKLVIVSFLTVVIPCIYAVLPSFSKKWVPGLVSMGMVLLGAGLIRMSFNQVKYDLIEYDFLVRTERWSDVLAKAKECDTKTPMTVAAVNLALSQKGLLADRIFEYYQNGSEGLIPTFNRDMSSPVMTAEIFFKMGMVNDAHRYMYEAQEAIPNYRKSGRFSKRIVQCEIVNGQYEVAAKYLRMFQHTLFYKKWADETLELIQNPQSLDKHPLYGWLRQIRFGGEDFLFSDMEMDQMFGLLFVGNKKNRMAYEYLICYVLLQRDLDKFMKYYSLGQYVGYKSIPRAFQEVLIGEWMQRNTDVRKIPYSVDSHVLNTTADFVRIYASGRDRQLLNHPPYCYNALHYLLLNDLGKENRTQNELKEIY